MRGHLRAHRGETLFGHRQRPEQRRQHPERAALVGHEVVEVQAACGEFIQERSEAAQCRIRAGKRSAKPFDDDDDDVRRTAIAGRREKRPECIRCAFRAQEGIARFRHVGGIGGSRSGVGTADCLRRLTTPQPQAVGNQIRSLAGGDVALRFASQPADADRNRQEP